MRGYCFKIIIFLCCAFALESLRAQELSLLRFKTIKAAGDTLQLDSLSILKESVMVWDGHSRKIEESDYEIDAIAATLRWIKKPVTDSIEITYRTFPYNFSKTVFRKDVSKIDTTGEYQVNPFTYVPETEARTFIDFGTLEYNGSFARGLSFGNNQDVVLNSSFNLQLAGNITEDIEIVAALTDNNIPIQPDGTTQQLQEFDKVFIQVTKKPHTITVGDYQLASPEGHFMKFFKKPQGISYSGAFDIIDVGHFKTKAAFAVAKGKYNKYDLAVTEGNQGPYKLVGANGETFIIVLAGTERVYVNGKLLKRGSENDYIIDYNLGEIIFTPNVLITQDLRVSVEFEYSERSYFRTMFFTNAALEREKVKFRLNFYSEQDSKNQPADIDLTPEQKALLKDVGDDLGQVPFPGYELAEFDKDRILYKLVDSTVGGTHYDTVFVYSTDPDSAKYSVVFSFVGQGQGDYVPAATTANGRVFRWVAPQNGISQGTYIPARILVTPKRQQMTTLGIDVTPTENDVLTVEGALSNNDLNTFSEKDQGDNIGGATKLGYVRNFSIGPESKQQHISLDADYEYVHHNFRELERYRSVEFNRDWNYRRPEDRVDEHLAGAELSYVKENLGRVGYRFSTFHAIDTYKGYHQQLTSTINKKGYFLDVNFRYLQTESMEEKSKFIRPTVEASKAFAKLHGWKIGGRYEGENNKFRDAQSDSLLAKSFVYNDWRVYIANADTATDKVRVEYIRRLEFYPRNNDFDLINLSNTANFRGQWLSNQHQKIGWQLTYRAFNTKDSTLAEKELQHYYLGRIEYNLNVLRGAINTSIVYELGAGKEQRIEYTYLPVDPGQGNFIYGGDYNGNNKQDVNEFEVAPSSYEGDYVRVLNPTNEFDAVNGTEFSQSLNLNPKAVWYGKSGIKGFVARLSTVTSVQINRKTYADAKASPFNPFLFDVEDTSLVSLNSIIRNSVFFNRSDPVYSLEYTYQDNRRKTNQAIGLESNKITEHLFRARWNIVRSVSGMVKYAMGNRVNTSKLFPERTYLIKSKEVEPQLTYLFKSKFKATIKYNFAYRENVLPEDGEIARSHEAAMELRYNVVSKSTLNAKFSFTTIAYNGAENSSIEFAMLQGLKDGNNYVWSASYDRNLAKAVQLSLIYDGRKTGDADPVHVGRVQVRAIF